MKRGDKKTRLEEESSQRRIPGSCLNGTLLTGKVRWRCEERAERWKRLGGRLKRLIARSPWRVSEPQDASDVVPEHEDHTRWWEMALHTVPLHTHYTEKPWSTHHLLLSCIHRVGLHIQPYTWVTYILSIPIWHAYLNLHGNQFTTRIIYRWNVRISVSFLTYDCMLSDDGKLSTEWSSQLISISSDSFVSAKSELPAVVVHLRVNYKIYTLEEVRRVKLSGVHIIVDHVDDSSLVASPWVLVLLQQQVMKCSPDEEIGRQELLKII